MLEFAAGVFVAYAVLGAMWAGRVFAYLESIDKTLKSILERQ